MKKINNFGKLPRVMFVLITSLLITLFIYGNSIFRTVYRFPSTLTSPDGKDSIKKTDTSRKSKKVYKPTKNDTKKKTDSSQNPFKGFKEIKIDTLKNPIINRNLLE
jgi:hypothetical protein